MEKRVGEIRAKRESYTLILNSRRRTGWTFPWRGGGVLGTIMVRFGVRPYRGLVFVQE